MSDNKPSKPAPIREGYQPKSPACGKERMNAGHQPQNSGGQNNPPKPPSGGSNVKPPPPSKSN